MKSIQYQISSKIGFIYLIASEQGLEGLFLTRQKAPLVKNLNRKDPAQRILSDVAKQIDEYFAGKRKSFDVPICFKGTAFQQKVWQELLKIPFGKTVAYKDIAKRIKNPQAVRAVGSANGKNPICIIVPCHRVIAADGSIGGYSGGIDVKRQLLALEQ